MRIGCVDYRRCHLKRVAFWLADQGLLLRRLHIERDWRKPFRGVRSSSSLVAATSGRFLILNSQWYTPGATCIVGLGLFLMVTTPLVGAAVYPRRLRLPRLLRWSYVRFPDVLAPYHRVYLVVVGLLLEAFPAAVWAVGWTAGSPLSLPSLGAELGLSLGWVLLLLHHAR
jgi:membrane-bound metal-dependent hydrolase YbcI (DUF457 family)